MHILTMLVLISLLIIVHEVGHFVAAKIFGVKVSKFALGLPFGPTLYKRQFGDTEFLIHAFLLGGYISFPDDKEDEKEENPELPMDSPLRFKNKTPWQQATILVAGVFMNAVFALFLVFSAALYYHKLPSGNFDVYIKEIKVENNDSNIIAAGARAGDRIIKINNEEINSTYKLVTTIEANKAPKTMNIVILREGQEVELKNVHTNKDGKLGIGLEAKEIFIKTDSPGLAFKGSCVYVYDSTRLILVGLKQLFTGKIPLKDMHGIVAITKIGGDVIEHSGLLNGLLLAAQISINLALLNLLPIPALDGGHLMFLALEKIRGRELNQEAIEKINSLFFYALLLFMIYVVFNDVFALITKKF